MNLSLFSLALVAAISVGIAGCSKKHDGHGPLIKKPKENTTLTQNQTPNNKAGSQALEILVNGRPVQGRMDKANAIATDNQGQLKMTLPDAELAALNTKGNQLINVFNVKVAYKTGYDSVFQKATSGDLTVLLDLENPDEQLWLILHNKAIDELLITRVGHNLTNKDAVRFYVRFPEPVELTRPFTLDEALGLSSPPKTQSRTAGTPQIYVYVKTVKSLNTALQSERLKPGITVRLFVEQQDGTLTRVEVALGTPGHETLLEIIENSGVYAPNSVIGAEIQYNSLLTKGVDEIKMVAFDGEKVKKISAFLAEQSITTRSSNNANSQGPTIQKSQEGQAVESVYPGIETLNVNTVAEAAKAGPSDRTSNTGTGPVTHKGITGDLLFVVGLFNRVAEGYSANKVPVATQKTTIKGLLAKLNSAAAIGDVTIVRDNGLLVESDHTLAGEAASDFGVYIRLHSGEALAVSFCKRNVNAVKEAVKSL